MSLPAIEDITAHTGTTDPIDGVIRIETSPKEKATPIILEMMRSVYPHDEVFGEFCTVNDYIDCPPDELFDYMAEPAAWRSGRTACVASHPPNSPDCGWRTTGWAPGAGPGSAIYTRTHANRQALTVDYHCAWDQGKHLWMIYLMRIVDAQVVFDKPGSVVLWTNCHHPFYDRTPTRKPHHPGDRSGSVTSGTCSAPVTCWN